MEYIVVGATYSAYKFSILKHGQSAFVNSSKLFAFKNKIVQ